jgi:DNA-binding HxlR family transcriptional regulator
LKGTVLQADDDNRPGAPGDVEWDRVTEVLAAVSGRWQLSCLRHLASGQSRPADLLPAINAEQDAGGGPSLSAKVLYDTLRRLTVLGLVMRVELAGGNPKEVHYWLTDAGHAMLTRVARLGGGSYWYDAGGNTSDPGIEGVNPAQPTPARLWAVFAGADKSTFEADRIAAARAEEAMPGLSLVARHVRLFQASAIRRLVGLGVRQFLDIGTGLPVANAVHEVAQREAPESRVVYVDNDPLVLAHARALLTSTPQGACAYIQADLRDPGMILARAAETLDLTRPVAILLMAVLHFVSDDEDPWAITGRLVGGVTGPCYLAICHAASDLAPAQAAQLMKEYNTRSSVPITMRDRDEVARMFAATQMLEPGLVELAEWWPEQRLPGAGEFGLHGHVGIGYRPAVP